MTEKYIDDDKTIILAVSPANNDLSNSDAISIQRKIDPEGERTIGVLTKIDICDDEDAKEQIQKNLQNQEFELKHGWFGLKCRSSNDIDNDISIEQGIINEEEYFKTKVPYAHMDQSLFGTSNLSIKMREHFDWSMKKDLPDIYVKVKNKMDFIQSELDKIGEGPPQTEMEKMMFLIKLIKVFEENLQKSLQG